MSALPVRTCVGCRQRATKHELLRVVVAETGAGLEVVPDPSGHAPGRGAHLHPTPGCLELAVRRKAFGRALRAGPGLGTAQLEAHLCNSGRDPDGDDGDRPGAAPN